MLRRDGTDQADATVGDGPHPDPGQCLSDGPLCVPSPVCSPAAAAALFRAADPAAHPVVLIDVGSIAGLNSTSRERLRMPVVGVSRCPANGPFRVLVCCGNTARRICFSVSANQ